MCPWYGSLPACVSWNYKVWTQSQHITLSPLKRCLDPIITTTRQTFVIMAHSKHSSEELIHSREDMGLAVQGVGKRGHPGQSKQNEKEHSHFENAHVLVWWVRTGVVSREGCIEFYCGQCQWEHSHSAMALKLGQKVGYWNSFKLAEQEPLIEASMSSTLTSSA